MLINNRAECKHSFPYYVDNEWTIKAENVKSGKEIDNKTNKYPVEHIHICSKWQTWRAVRIFVSVSE
jgi:hypothetical protein